ncbi:helix-turn-helix domain-containing protein [Vibrio hibernica]|uniref:helix-turn-helix domain-containing protein n=1 Tax=Vibrio hibernica TaxID=2587465 RepID=UPI00389A5BAB
MLTKEIFVDIITLYRQGKSMRAIARELNISRNTVKKYIVEPDAYPQYKARLTTQSKLTPYKQYNLHLYGSIHK